MMVKGHLIVATSCYMLYKDYQQPEGIDYSLNMLLEYFIVMFGVLIPDIDHPKSTIGRRVKFLSYPINLVFGHRGLTHSLFFWSLLYWLTVHYDLKILSLLCIGSALHLVGDYLTPSGIPLFAPLSRKTYRGPLVTDTNSFTEHLFSFGILFFAIWHIYT